MDRLTVDSWEDSGGEEPSSDFSSPKSSAGWSDIRWRSLQVLGMSCTFCWSKARSLGMIDESEEEDEEVVMTKNCVLACVCLVGGIIFHSHKEHNDRLDPVMKLLLHIKSCSRRSFGDCCIDYVVSSCEAAQDVWEILRV